jgi:hypothetical protein
MQSCGSGDPDFIDDRDEDYYERQAEEAAEDNFEMDREIESEKTQVAAEAERWETQEAEWNAETEEICKDDIRSCILEGNQPNLCELDPHDPYGTGNWRQ